MFFLLSTKKCIEKSDHILNRLKALKEEKEKEGKNEMIIKLNYVTKINDKKNNMENLFKELMKSLTFKYKEKKDNNSIEFEEFYFNGLPIPKNINFKNNKGNEITVTWDVDKIKFSGEDNFINNLKYRIKMSKENKEQEETFEVEKQKKYQIKNLDCSTNYNFKICSIYSNNNDNNNNKELESFFSEKVSIKTNLIIDSVILKNYGIEEESIKNLKEWLPMKKFKLLYRGSRDGLTAKAFHDK